MEACGGVARDAARPHRGRGPIAIVGRLRSSAQASGHTARISGVPSSKTMKDNGNPSRQ
jgi:hypothetical protein